MLIIWQNIIEFENNRNHRNDDIFRFIIIELSGSLSFPEKWGVNTTW